MRKHAVGIISLLCAVLAGCEGQAGSVTEQAQTAQSAAQEAMSQAESAKEAVESMAAYGQGLYDSYASGGDGDFSTFDAYFEKLDKVNAAIDEYILDRNADLLKPGEIQFLPGGSVSSEDFEYLKEFREIYSALQYNYNKDDDGVLRLADIGDDVIMFSFKEEEDGSITITDTRFAEKGEKEAASLQEMCDELGTSYDDAAEMLAFNRAYAVHDMIRYMDNNPDVTGVEYEGEVRTRDELEEIETERLREIFPDDFVEEE